MALFFNYIVTSGAPTGRRETPDQLSSDTAAANHLSLLLWFGLFTGLQSLKTVPTTRRTAPTCTFRFEKSQPPSLQPHAAAPAAYRSTPSRLYPPNHFHRFLATPGPTVVVAVPPVLDHHWRAHPSLLGTERTAVVPVDRRGKPRHGPRCFFFFRVERMSFFATAVLVQ